MREFKVFAAGRAMDAAAAYAARGRAYQGLSDTRLAEKWAAAFRSTVRQPARSDLRELERDLSSEHKLRGHNVPHEAIAEDRELLIAQIIVAYERSRDALEGMVLVAGAADYDRKGLRTN